MQLFNNTLTVVKIFEHASSMENNMVSGLVDAIGCKYLSWPFTYIGVLLGGTLN